MLSFPRATIEDIVRYRAEAIRLYEIAHGKIAANASPGTNSYNYSQADEIKAFHGAVSLPDRERYLRTARRLIDLNAWAWIVERTELERLMDHQAKEQLRAQMRYIPDRVDRDGQLINEGEIDKGMPPLTVENIMATLEQFALDADTRDILIDIERVLAVLDGHSEANFTSALYAIDVDRRHLESRSKRDRDGLLQDPRFHERKRPSLVSAP